MLKGISPLLSPQLLATLCEMGHGDTIVLGDAHFPSVSLGPQVIRADGLPIDRLIEAIMPIFELDSYVENPVMMMAPVRGDSLNEEFVSTVRKLVNKPIAFLERQNFYDNSRKAFAIVHTGETRQYGNIILQKGVILP